MSPITLNLSALAALGELDPAKRRRLAASILAALSIAPEDLTAADEEHAAALSRVRELTSELDAATDRAERAEAALESASGPLSVLSAGGLAAVALADVSPIDSGECEPLAPAEPEDLGPIEAEPIPQPVADYLEELDPQLREAFADLHDLACAAGFEPEAALTGIDCPEHDLGAIGVTLRILGLLLFLWRSGALGGLVSASDLPAAEGPSATPPNEGPSAASSIAVELPRISTHSLAEDPVSEAGGDRGFGDAAPLATPAISIEPAPSPGDATTPKQTAPGRAPLDPSAPGDALQIAASAEPEALTEADLEPIEEPIQGDPITGWAILGQAIGAGANLDRDWLAGALQTSQDGADVLAALGAEALLPVAGPAVGSLDSEDRADLIALVEEQISASAAWGMIWGRAGDGWIVARPWVYLSAAEDSRSEYVHRIPVEDWADARRAWLDLEAATRLLLSRRDVLMDAIYLDQETAELRPARSGRGNLGAHVSQLGAPEICALARIEAPGLKGLGSPAGWAALYSDDERVRIAYQRVKGHRDHLAISRRSNAEPDSESRGWIGKFWGRE